MDDDRVRSTVALYLTGDLTEAEAVRRADISRSELRHYARTSGAALAAPAHEPEDDSEPA